MPSTDERISAHESPHPLQELKIHQHELEIQNEQQRKSHAELEGSQARLLDLYDCAPVGYCTISAS